MVLEEREVEVHVVGGEHASLEVRGERPQRGGCVGGAPQGESRDAVYMPRAERGERPVWWLHVGDPRALDRARGVAEHDGDLEEVVLGGLEPGGLDVHHGEPEVVDAVRHGCVLMTITLGHGCDRSVSRRPLG